MKINSSFTSFFSFFPVLIVSILVSSNGFAEEPIVVTERFEEPPSRWVTLVDGVKGKAGLFTKEASCYVKLDCRCSRIELEFHFNSEDAESSGAEMQDWRPLIRTQLWKYQGFQLAIRNKRLCFMFHNGGTNRTLLESPPLENNRWYRGRFVIDTDKHLASLDLDGKEVASGAINADVYYLNLASLAVGTILHTSGYAFKGMIDEINVVMKPIPDRGTDDPRNIDKGHPIPRELYCDQPYIVILPDKTWVCTLTTGSGHEGEKGQHIVATHSKDGGKTWGPLIDIEPAGEISASWVVPFLTPYGRLYGFYSYNGDNVKLGRRDDSHGWYAYRYSDDGGYTWSKERYRIPIRRTACDTLVKDGKIVQMFWGVCKPRVEGNDFFLPFSKLGEYVYKMGEGWIVHSNNILTERDPEKIHWELLPEGEHGIRNSEFGSVQEEHILVPMDRKDTFFCIYRTGSGFPAFSISRDRCRTWSMPEPMCYANGRVIRHPRACPMVWKTGPGKYLFWCHNNACEVTENRNPVWICAGLEVDGKIMWSQPEIILYADEPSLGMSYPDLIVMDGEYRISETQKSVARVHSVDKTIFEGAWKRLAEELEGKPSQRVREGLLVETSQKEIVFPAELKNALKNKGVTFDFLINVPENGFEPGTLLFGNPTADGKGFAVRGREDGAFSFEARGDSDDNRDVILWTFDPGLLTPGAHAVTIIIEAAPRIVTAIVDGRYVDGDGKRIFGWGRYYNAPNRFEGSGKIAIAPEVSTLRVYDRPLRTYEALSNQSVGE